VRQVEVRLLAVWLMGEVSASSYCLVFPLQYASLRALFDRLCHSCKTPSELLPMCRLFLVFYTEKKDQERLVSGDWSGGWRLVW